MPAPDIGNLGSPLVAQGVIDDHPDAAAGDEGGQQTDQQDTRDFIEIPDGLGEQAVGCGVVAMLGLPCGFPDAADGVPTEADDPGGDHASEEVKDLLAEGDEDLRPKPISERRRRLEKMLGGADAPIHVTPVTTDPKTGRARVSLKADDEAGGSYVVRVAGTDSRRALVWAS